jgi:hypothetical protein
VTQVLDAAYDEEIKVEEPRLEFKTEAFQSILDETAKARPVGEKNQTPKTSSTGAILTEWRKMVSLTNSGRENDHPYDRRLLNNLVEHNIDILRAHRHGIFLIVAG